MAPICANESIPAASIRSFEASNRCRGPNPHPPPLSSPKFSLDVIDIILDLAELLLFGTDSIFNIGDLVFKAISDLIGSATRPQIVDSIAPAGNIAFVMLD